MQRGRPHRQCQLIHIYDKTGSKLSAVDNGTRLEPA